MVPFFPSLLMMSLIFEQMEFSNSGFESEFFRRNGATVSNSALSGERSSRLEYRSPVKSIFGSLL